MKRISLLMVVLLAVTGAYLVSNGCSKRCVDCPKVIKTVILEGVNFAFDKADLLPVAYPILEDDVKLLKNNTKLQLSIEGHCDIRGSDVYNQKLSERQAKSIYKSGNPIQWQFSIQQV